MRLKPLTLAGLLAIPAFLFTTTAHATPVTGQANIAGNVSVTATTITFQPTFTNTAGAMETGAFAGLTGGTIQSLSGGPVTGNVNIPAFANFTTGVATPITFDLTYIAPGVGTLAGCSSSTPGAECTPAGSPFTLFQLTSNTVIASLQFNGVSYTGSAGTGTSPTTSIFSTQTALNGTIPQVLAELNSAGGIQGITYSASFTATSPVPEPASLLLMGFGLVGAGLIARRKLHN
jgi:hypothetical protein